MAPSKKPNILETIIPNIPEVPGVYQMKNTSGKIIYVGKSINLRSRVRSYFSDSSALNAAKTKMVSEIRTIEWIETRSEAEALILETNLIKKLSPKYNVLMKDDKNLTYVRIESGIVSDIVRVRSKTSDNGEYFGPFPSWARISQTLQALKRIFRIRSCPMKFGTTPDGRAEILVKAGRTPPCMDYYIGICPGPCLLTDKALNDHKENTEALRQFLRGNTSNVTEMLQTKMREHAKKLEFEEAKKIKDQLDSIAFLSERQIARNAVDGDVDAFFLLEKYGKLFAGFAVIRDGELRAMHRSSIENPLDLEKGELVVEAIARQYLKEESDLPNTLLISGGEGTIADTGLLEILKNRKIHIEYPEIGPKAELLTFLKTNLLNFAYQAEMENLTKRTLSRATMKSILEAIGYSAPSKGPISFECYDISHTDGHFTVASRVVIEDGKPKNSAYKKYKIKTLADGMIDDFASMREVLERRTQEGLEFNNFPTMILIDGGKWQLSAAKGAMERVQEEFMHEHENTTPTLSDDAGTPAEPLPPPPPLPFLASLAKREEEIFVPGKSESHLFTKDSAELAVLQTVRDEAHRFAIGFNRAKRTKEMKKNILEELPGFGPTTRKKLLKIAGSVSGIPELSDEELASVLTKTQIETLKDHGMR